VVSHSIIWRTDLQKHAGPGSKQKSWMYICDLEIGTIAEQGIDRVLEFVSCPMPALTSLSKHEQRRQIRNIVRQGIQGDNSAMLAHCTSVAELRYVASEVKEHSAASLSRSVD
jgi:hypothetical protein